MAALMGFIAIIVASSAVVDGFYSGSFTALVILGFFSICFLFDGPCQRSWCRSVAGSDGGSWVGAVDGYSVGGGGAD
ncbi:hypothetical protein [Actinoplanes sp. G11-F43]|uniref:hypothetical protein n=1 Tax=Actinoplanes sp. G11-F43 TaxID=3424130 RepID=UPI003D352382